LRKVIIFQKREAGVDRPAFSRWALREQVLLVEKIPGLRRCVVSLEAEGREEAFDAATEMCFADAEEAESGLRSASGEQALADMRTHASRMEHVHLIEHELVATALPAPFKLMAALKRRNDLTRSDFKTWWIDRHAPFVVAFPELRRYQVNVVEDGPESFVDGVAEVCFADLPALQRIMSRSDVRNVQQDSQVHTQARYRMFVEEHVVLASS
jgi:hypothetical protein